MKPRRRRPVMPDSRLPLRCLVDALPGLIGLALLALAAWGWRPVTLAERVERIDAEAREMEASRE